MDRNRNSGLITGLFVGATFLPAALMFTWVSSATESGEIWAMSIALTISALVGGIIGWRVKPEAPNAGCIVVVSPVITLFLLSLALGGYEILVRHQPASRALAAIVLFSVSMVIFALPTAGFARLTHWLRNRQS